jgi:hypothetical protein
VAHNPLAQTKIFLEGTKVWKTKKKETFCLLTSQKNFHSFAGVPFSFFSPFAFFFFWWWFLLTHHLTKKKAKGKKKKRHSHKRERKKHELTCVHLQCITMLSFLFSFLFFLCHQLSLGDKKKKRKGGEEK